MLSHGVTIDTVTSRFQVDQSEHGTGLAVTTSSDDKKGASNLRKLSFVLQVAFSCFFFSLSSFHSVRASRVPIFFKAELVFPRFHLAIFFLCCFIDHKASGDRRPTLSDFIQRDLELSFHIDTVSIRRPRETADSRDSNWISAASSRFFRLTG